MYKNRLERFMRARGFRVGRDPLLYSKFHDWTVDNQREFYAIALEDLAFPWLKRPSEILRYDPSEPIWKAQWFPGGEANVYDACVENQVRLGRGSYTALIWRREDGAGVELTFDEVKRNVDIIAAQLKASGVRRGDGVAISMPSSHFAYLLFYAVQKIGAIFIPIATEIMDIALIKRLSMTKPKLIFTVNGFFYNKKRLDGVSNILYAAAKLKETENYVSEVIVIDYTGDSTETNYPGKKFVYYNSWIERPLNGPAQTEHLSSDDVTMILFTSGTTGTPKGTLHTFRALIEDMIENAYASDVNVGDRFLWYTSPGWMMFPWLVMGVNGLGGTVVLYDGSPTVNGNETLLELAESVRLTHMGLSPPLISGVLDALKTTRDWKKRLKYLREIRYTSSPLAQTVAKRMAKLGYPPAGVCGGTDGCFAYCSGNPLTKRYGATMMPSLGIDVNVEIRNDSVWRKAKAGEIGQIVIKRPFPSMTNGLLNDDERKSHFRAAYFGYEDTSNRPESSEIKYWIHGDLASFDKKGRFTVHGRADDLLIVHGNKISPADVQDVILRLNNEIADVAPISMSIKNDDGGELLVFAVLKPISGSKNRVKNEVLEDRIKACVKEHVNRLAKPYAVFFVKEIPYTINNKPALRLVRDAFGGSTVGDTSTIKNKESVAEFTELGRRFRMTLAGTKHLRGHKFINLRRAK